MIFHINYDLLYICYNCLTSSLFLAILTTVPFLPDLLALPALCTAYSLSTGISKFITKFILLISIPLAIISLVIITLFFPSLNWIRLSYLSWADKWLCNDTIPNYLFSYVN